MRNLTHILRLVSLACSARFGWGQGVVSSVSDQPRGGRHNGLGWGNPDRLCAKLSLELGVGHDDLTSAFSAGKHGILKISQADQRQQQWALLALCLCVVGLCVLGWHREENENHVVRCDQDFWCQYQFPIMPSCMEAKAKQKQQKTRSNPKDTTKRMTY